MRTLFFVLLLALSGCAGINQMQETGEVPSSVSNTSKALLQAYCESPILSNVENILVRWIQATVAPEWVRICDTYEEMKAERAAEAATALAILASGTNADANEDDN